MNKTMYAALVLCIIFVDRVTKIWAQIRCVEPLLINQFLSCSLIYNRGVAFSLVASHDPFIFCAVSMVVLFLTIMIAMYSYHRLLAHKSIWGECAIIAGSISNIYDRYTFGGVLDFIEFSYGSLHFPSFNFADIAIVCGVMISLIQTYKEDI